ncbi:hypothetical protein TrispH2_011668 [Trichoplax sp. H2]|nr:hypothetical protein TrispH2_011668 [Trichoplax sp. H2]|eukprot:RDD36397.1 hypothetical protein TrispH2_011668 [Trichoplax sp. H2]
MVKYPKIRRPIYDKKLCLHFNLLIDTYSRSAYTRRTAPPICGNSVIALKVYETLVIACPGGWRGHISNAKLCARGYHVCNKNDRASLLSKITFSRGIQIPGCYAFNAAHDFGRCIDCKNREHQDDLGGVGMTCPRKTTSQNISCLTGGTIDAAMGVSSFATNRACHYHPGISGVLCCEN